MGIISLVNQPVLVLLPFICCLCCRAALTDPSELAVVSALVDSNNGPILTAFNPGDCTYDPNFPVGLEDPPPIECNAPFSPSHIKLIKLNNLPPTLTFTLPPSIGNLSSLNSLQIYSNPSLVGTLPSAWTSLSSLTYLKLDHNPRLSGTLPAWESMSRLAKLYLNHCPLSGTIPVQWSSMTSLAGLYTGATSIWGAPVKLSYSYGSLFIEGLGPEWSVCSAPAYFYPRSWAVPRNCSRDTDCPIGHYCGNCSELGLYPAAGNMCRPCTSHPDPRGCDCAVNGTAFGLYPACSPCTGIPGCAVAETCTGPSDQQCPQCEAGNFRSPSAAACARCSNGGADYHCGS